MQMRGRSLNHAKFPNTQAAGAYLGPEVSGSLRSTGCLFRPRAPRTDNHPEPAQDPIATGGGSLRRFRTTDTQHVSGQETAAMASKNQRYRLTSSACPISMRNFPAAGA
eukprot:366891-Rhodomonas_salina.3